MDVSEVLKQAWAAVEKADLPDGIQGVAFREAVHLIAPAPVPAPASASGAPAQAPRPGSSSNGRSTGTVGPDGVIGSNGESRTDISESEMYDKVVEKTGVDHDKLEQIVHLDDDRPRVSVAGPKLGKNNAERARAVAQILTVIRDVGMDESETSLDIIRAECERLRVHDTANFSAQMKALTGYVINGTGQNRRLRAKTAGIAAFPALVNGLVADS